MQNVTALKTQSNAISSTEEIIEEIRNGRMVVIIDDEDRENEGDLIVAAQMATPEVINFMARYGRGLVCLPLTEKRVRELGLPLMARDNQSRNHTNFTVSIEAREGISTGISAADRAHTISVAINHNHTAADLVSPGHVFPLMAREGGVLVRAGHTEAAVDFARLSGLTPAGVICEIMNDDGTMARLPDLKKFAQQHGLKIGTIQDLISYRRRTEKMITCVQEQKFTRPNGAVYRQCIYQNNYDNTQHTALIWGNITAEPTWVRVHVVGGVDDIIGQGNQDIHTAMNMIEQQKSGVLILLSNTAPSTPSDVARNYGLGSQMLADIGIQKMVVISNHPPKTIVGLEAYGLSIVDHQKIKDV